MDLMIVCLETNILPNTDTRRWKITSLRAYQLTVDLLLNNLQNGSLLFYL